MPDYDTRHKDGCDEPDVSCLDYRPDDITCKGEVSEHPSLAGTGNLHPRCEFHYDKHLARHQEHIKVYPDSDIPPSWFDPAAAGERWNDDY